MTNAIQVFKPAFRVEDSNGDPVSGAIIYFYTAGTTTPLTVYSDKGLSTSLGTSVTTNSAGVPTSDGSTVCEVYTGTAAYKVQIKDSSLTLVPGFSWDNITGAGDTSGFVSTAGLVVGFAAKSADYTVLAADSGKMIEVDTTSATCTMTLPSAATVGATFLIGFRKKVAGNTVAIASVSSQTIRVDGSTTPTTYTMYGGGEYVWLESDGANWVVRDLRMTAQPFIMLTADYTLTDSSTAQKAFNSPTNGTYAVSASTTYQFDFEFLISSTGTTSHTWAALIALTTATLTSSSMVVHGRTGTTGATTFTADLSGFTTDVTTALVATAASTSATEFVVLSGRGVLRVNAAGSITPQVKLSAQTNGTPKMLANSWFKLTALGSNTIASVGNWS